MGIIGFSHGSKWQGLLLQAHHKKEEEAAAQGSLGELAAPIFPCSPNPSETHLVWGCGASLGELHAGDSGVTSGKGGECSQWLWTWFGDGGTGHSDDHQKSSFTSLAWFPPLVGKQCWLLTNISCLSTGFLAAPSVLPSPVTAGHPPFQLSQLGPGIPLEFLSHLCNTCIFPTFQLWLRAVTHVSPSCGTSQGKCCSCQGHGELPPELQLAPLGILA